MKNKKNKDSSTNIGKFSNWNNYANFTLDDANFNNSTTYTINTESTFTSFTIPTKEQFDNLTDDVEKIKQRLAILDDPSPEKLERHKMLRDAYNKYKMIEKLIGE